MSGDTVILFFDDHENRKAWRFLWGGETFYDEKDRLMMWDTVDDALEWLEGQEKYKHLTAMIEIKDFEEPEKEQEKVEEEPEEDDRQISMF